MNRKMKRNTMKQSRNVLLVVALMLVVCIASIGGTIAWLTDVEAPVVNTFSPSNIELTLDEADADDSDKDNDTNDRDKNNTYQMIPGTIASKDPKVTIENDVDAWLFVVVDESWNVTVGSDADVKTYNLGDYLGYDLKLDSGEGGDGWTKLPDSTFTGGDIYYRAVEANAENNSFELLEAGSYKYTPAGGNEKTVMFEANQVAFREDVTKDMMDAIDPNDKPTIKFTAYAIQQAGFYDGGNPSAAKAWEEVRKLNTNS